MQIDLDLDCIPEQQHGKTFFRQTNSSGQTLVVGSGSLETLPGAFGVVEALLVAVAWWWCRSILSYVVNFRCVPNFQRELSLAECGQEEFLTSFP
jgi:hypothetical protein